MTTATAPTLARAENEYSTLYTAPITLRALEAAGFEFEGGFGIDADERAEMLDEQGLLRIRFGGHEEDGDASCILMVECYQGTLRNPAGSWQDCGRRYSFAAGSKERNCYRRNELRAWDALRSLVPNADELARAATQELQAALDQCKRDNGMVECSTCSEWIDPAIGCGNCSDLN